MTISLGIHVGHDAAVALVIDGELVAAVGQERVTRIKHDGGHSLSDHLPLQECLGSAGLKIDDVDFITTSIQSAAPGGIGLRTPLVSPGFNCFDPYDARHSAMSHHLAHAISGFALFSAKDATIIVHDRAGSATHDGKDFYLPFSQWAYQLRSADCNGPVISENLSIYSAAESCPPELKHRSFCIPHVNSSVYVDSVSALYDNVSRHVFGNSDAHGQLMALAGMASKGENSRALFGKVAFLENQDGLLALQNGWQASIASHRSPEHFVALAHATQELTEVALLRLVEVGVGITGQHNVVAVGGAFLNVVANTVCASSPLIHNFFVPPAPHDAGIAIGCAYAPFYFHQASRKGSGLEKRCPLRLGREYSDNDVAAAVRKVAWALSSEGQRLIPDEAARLLHKGEVIARCSGRSEFGPRALGGRSILASPFVRGIAARLNRIKNRQAWRPVAPITTSEKFLDLFDCPTSSYMQFASRFKKNYASILKEAMHYDGTARPQSLENSADPWLHSLLVCTGDVVGVPVLLNTSFNIAGEPMVENFDDALAAFLLAEDIDSVLLNDIRVRRKDLSYLAGLNLANLRLVEQAALSITVGRNSLRTTISLGRRRQQVPTCLSPLVAEALAMGDVTRDWNRLDSAERARGATFIAALKLLGFVTDVEFTSRSQNTVHASNDSRDART